MADEAVTDFKPTSLDEVISPPGAPVEPDKPVEEAKPEDTGVAETPQEEPAVEPDKGAPPAPETVPIAAVLDERRKRQRVEARLDELERKQSEEKRPDPIEDPDGAAKFDRENTDQQIRNLRVELSQQMMRQAHDDYDQMEAVFVDAVAKNPALIGEFNSSPNPAEYAYSQGKRLSQVNVMGDDPAAYIKQEIEKGIAAALAGAKPETPKAPIPRSLAESPSATVAPSTWSGPQSIDNILASRKR